VRAALTDTGINYEDVAVLCSGNGVQFFVEIDVPLIDVSQYDQLKLSYVALIKRMQANIKSLDATAEFDPSVWSRARIMRFPGTINEKPDKPSVEAFTVKNTIVAIKSPLTALVEEYKEEMQELPISRLPDPDTDAVLEQCGFLQWCYDNQDKVTEPQWMAMLGIVGRLDDGENLAHKYSSKHPSYDSGATESKLAHALEYGPRTCVSIASMYDGCKSCQHWEKCTSPIVIRGDLWCGTKDSGFHNIIFDAEGNVKAQKPDRNGLAKYLIKNEKLRSTGDTVYQWNGDKYVGLDDTRFLGKVHAMYNPLPATIGVARETVDILKAHDKAAVDRNEELSMRYLNFRNGILDKKENVLLEKTDKYFFRYCLDFNFNAAATCPRFDEFMATISCGDREIEATLLEFGGYALSGDEPWEHKALILYGDGANGKSTFMSVLKLLAGYENCTSLGIRKLAEPNTARLVEGKLFNAADETPVDAFRKHAELFKNLVAGGVIDAHKKYHDSYEFRNRAKIIFSCNDLPGISGIDSGITRRLILVPFNASFLDNANKFILDELKEELPGIFNKMWHAYLVAKERKSISIPEVSFELLKELRYNSNPVISFLEDACKITGEQEDKLLNKEIYTEFSNYCIENGFRNSMSQIHFSKAISVIARREVGLVAYKNNGDRGFKGIKLVSQGDI
jgi:putative DNA primase/helicase